MVKTYNKKAFVDTSGIVTGVYHIDELIYPPEGEVVIYDFCYDFCEGQKYLLTLEKALNGLRIDRNKLMKECDWTVLTDSPLNEEQQDEAVLYRQQLRNITKNLNTIEDVSLVNFPEKPYFIQEKWI